MARARTIVLPRKAPKIQAADGPLAEANRELWELREQKKAIEEGINDVRDNAVLPAFREAGVQQVTFEATTPDGTYRIRATCNPDPEPRFKVDPDKLRAAVGEQVWDTMVHRRVVEELDMSLVDAWVSQDPDNRSATIQDAFIELAPVTPSPRYTVESFTPQGAP